MLPRKKSGLRWSIAVVLVFLVAESEQRGDGAPTSACLNQMPEHGMPPQSTVPPYIILTSNSQVRQGDTLNVTITSPGGSSTPIGGFIIQARAIQNPDMIVGRFTQVSNPEMLKIISCRGDNDTVTHTTPQDKRNLLFIWRAPEDFLGGIEFRATVAQSYTTFWMNIESNLIEVVPPNAVISTVPIITTTSTIPPPIIMESKPSPPPRSVDSIYQGCGDTKLCFGIPEGCVQKADCQGIVSVFVAGDDYTFEMQATDNPKYVATALSMDSKMGDDSAMECVQNNGRITLHSSWTYPKVEPYVSRSDSPQNILTLLASSFVDGKLFCRFRRETVSTVKGVTFDLANKQYNLMIVAGSGMKDENRVGFHNKVFAATGAPMALSVVGTATGPSKVLLKLHGCFMIAAWIGSASLGILLARYFRQTWVGKRLGGKDIWFAYHRIFMVTTWLLTIAGFILILIEVGGWSTTGDNPHAITGLVTVILCFIQPIGAYFRPHPGTQHRPIFNWLHWLVGNAAHILAIATIFLAVYLQKAELPSWTVYILAAFVAFHVIMHLILSLTVCVADGRISKGRVNVFPMKDMLGHTRQVTAVDRDTDAPYSSFRKLLLGVYAPIIIILAIVVICLVALAPIVQTYNNVSEVLNNAVAKNGVNK